jgi:WD40 repeat protein
MEVFNSNALPLIPSPTEADVFATCSSDHTVKIWDARIKKQSARSFEAADCDVNSIAWNKYRIFLEISL